MITPESLCKSGTEHAEQMALFCWASQERNRWKRLRWMYAVPNGGGRTMQQGLALKAEGVKSGVADVCLPEPNLTMGFHGLYLEMKRRNGVPSDVSKDQLEFGAHVTLRGYAWHVSFGWQEAVSIVEAYLAGMVPRLSPHQQKVHMQMMEIVNGPQS